MAESRENEGDEELNKARPRVSKVWEYFTDAKPKKSVKCRICCVSTNELLNSAKLTA
ncbi:hypothetical protein NQZ68_008299 [Dissostichus eleginoides]|nr:hypothetical protein NQZ68_008299 [Dissostichus eleginoides]